MLSVNTNTGAMIALQYLNQTQVDMSQTQTAISTGLKVASAKDDGATYAIAQNMRGNVAGYAAVSDSLNRGMSRSTSPCRPASRFPICWSQMKSKALAAADTSIDTASRQALNQDFTALRDQITYDRRRMRCSTASTWSTVRPTRSRHHGPGLVRRYAPHHGQRQKMSLSGSIVTIASTGTISTQAKASTMIAVVQTSLTNVNSALAKLSAGAKKFSIQTRLHPEAVRHADHRHRQSGRCQHGRRKAPC